MSLKNVGSRIELRKLKGVLEKSHVPILLTSTSSTSLFGEKDELPHWVTLIGYNKDVWYVNNPLGRRPNKRLNQKMLEENLGFQQIQCAVILRGLSKRTAAMAAHSRGY